VKIGLVGFQGSGKTSVFNALTGQNAETGVSRKGSKNLGRIQVPDERVDALSKIYNPKKTTYAEIQFVDVAGPAEGEQRSESGLDPEIVGQVREADALVQVVRGFDSSQSGKPGDPVREVAGFQDELILTDLLQIENRASRLRKQARTKELDLMEKLEKELGAGHPVRSIKLETDELQAVAGFRFLSQKPQLAVLNQAESDVKNGVPAPVLAAAKERGLEVIGMCAPIEAEIMAMEPGDQAAFLADLGLSAPVRSRFIKAAYALLDLISFLTSGEDEVRAWTIRRNTGARTAAGKIHSDIEHGFIRAEVTAFADFIKLGSEAKCKEAGKLRLEGKDYVVQDGDIVHFRHSG
jgi:GTP-binding protein YchF